MKKTITVLVVAIGLGIGLWFWGSLHFVYASGERAGYLQKFSRKGWIFKTWEGELAMVNLPGAMPEIFKFTVPDDGIAKQIEQAIGQRVALHYEYHPALPGRIFGDTAYFVTRINTDLTTSNPPPTPPPS